MKRIHVVGAAIIDDGRCLVAQRGPEMALAGYWEFPGGKIEAGESAHAALAREIREELGLAINVEFWLGRGTSQSENLEVVLDVYCSRIIDGRLDLKEHAQALWIDSEQISALEWAAADRPVLGALRKIL